MRAIVQDRYGSPEHLRVAALTELIEAGKLRPAIDRTFPLERVPDAIKYVESGQARGKVVIAIGQGSQGR